MQQEKDYDISTEELFLQSLNKHKFPYIRKCASKDFFKDNFKNYIPIIRKFEDGYSLGAYYPKYNMYLPSKYKSEFITVASHKNDSISIDNFSDIWMEPIRLKSKKSYKNKSPLELLKETQTYKKVWHKLRAVGAAKISGLLLRDLFGFILTEVKYFRLTWMKGILTLLSDGDLSFWKGKNWLDISSGWGDRLLCAGLLEMNYTGFDPNTELAEGYTQMIDYISQFNQTSQIKVYGLPFEESSEILKGKEFDLILTSPPFFDVEIYSQEKTQSIVKFKDYTQWMKCFLFESIRIAWNSLKEEGFLVLYIGDFKEKNFCEPLGLYVETLEKSSYIGIIGLENSEGIIRPCWVWKKSKERKRWNPGMGRSLKELYPALC